MAQVTVRVRLNRTFDVFCDGENEDQVMYDILNGGRLSDEFTSACEEVMEIEEATYDEPEKEEEAE